jgi:alginate O-acetyltransferase complex protein AlgI
MSFVSFHFAIFFVVVSLAFRALPHQWRWLWLVAASCWFYMALVPAYILILFALIAVDFGAGLWMGKTEDKRKRRWILIASLASNLAMLAAFKYLNFFLGNFSQAAEALGLGSLAWRFPWALPLGLSFHTFQSMAYTIEVYKGNRPPERHLGLYSLYVLFYPQMVAGPIERPQHLLEQLRHKQPFHWPDFVGGLQLMVWGLAKKVLVADRLAPVVEKVYADPAQQSGWMLLLGTIFFALQIYCDFSGYTDIARGAARTMGYKLMLNFNHPYCSRSPGEFWRRWHISLSTWFRDYVYIPLGGSHGPAWKTSRNILVVFLLSGFWHGANWTFLAWGGLHGLYLIAQRFLETRFGGSAAWQAWSGKRLTGAALVTLTFALTTLAWVFFRAADMASAWIVIRGMLAPGSLSGLGAAFQDSGVRLGVALILGLEALQWLHRRKSMLARLAAFPAPVRWALWYALILIVIIYGKFGNEEFLYFRF